LFLDGAPGPAGKSRGRRGAGRRRGGHGGRHRVLERRVSLLRAARRPEAARSRALAVEEPQGPGIAGRRERRFGAMKNALISGLLAAAGVCSVALAARDPAGPYKKLDVFSHVLSLIENNYVEQVDETRLLYGAIDGMVRTLDPHSNFMDPRSYSAL